MLYLVIFLCIITLLTSIFTGIVLFKGYTLGNHSKAEVEKEIEREVDKEADKEATAYFHSKIKELEDKIIQSTKDNLASNHNNSTSNQKHNPPAPKVIFDKKTYSQEEFLKEMNNGSFHMGSALESKLDETK